MKEKIEQVRPEIEWFAKRMEYKLRANDHKPHWSGSDMSYLVNRLDQEVLELMEALINGTTEEIINEAADVANFALMIADNAEGMRKADEANDTRHTPQP